MSDLVGSLIAFLEECEECTGEPPDSITVPERVHVSLVREMRGEFRLGAPYPLELFVHGTQIFASRRSKPKPGEVRTWTNPEGIP